MYINIKAMAALSERSLLNLLLKPPSATQLTARMISLTVSMYRDEGRKIAMRHRDAK
jgi:hypothetical protein